MGRRAGPHTHNMKSCSQLGWLPRTAMVVLFTFCTFRVTYVLNFSAAESGTIAGCPLSGPCAHLTPMVDRQARVPEPPDTIHSYIG